MTTYRWYRTKSGESRSRECVIKRWRGAWGTNFPKFLDKFCAKDPATKKWMPNFLLGSNDEIVSLDGRYVYAGKAMVDLQKGSPR